MKLKEYLDEGKEKKFVEAIKASVSIAQARKYRELAHEMIMSDKERQKVMKVLRVKLKELTPKRK